MEFIKTDLGQLLAWLITIIGGPPAIWFFWDKFSKQYNRDELIITITPEARDILFPKTVDTPTLKADIDRLPEPTAKLVGRETELAQLNDALIDPKKSVVAIIAGGGVGKSALTWTWLEKLQPNYDGAACVFGWSFYSQGSHQTTNSSAPFFQAALPFFGYKDALPTDEVEKGRQLAELLCQQPALLILDGIEPLQHPSHVMDGEIADVALKELLRCVRRNKLGQHQSLVVISTRQPIIEYEQWTEGYVPIDLQLLNNQDGARLLINLHVKGSQIELEQASIDMGGHALGLVLLGRLLVARFHGDITRRNQLPDLFEEAKEGGHALRVLRYYDKTYWQSPNLFKRFYQRLFNQDAPERIFLRLIGLFDRPMGLAEKEILFAKAKYAQPLSQLNNDEWLSVQQRLEQAGLLLKNERKGERLEWDVHPLVRNYFGQTFQKEQLKAYRQAQKVLFEYYQSIPDKHQPDTLEEEEMEPLYRAVVHGCLAGEYKKAFDVYFDRIIRGDDKTYRFKKLSAYAQNLTAISAFFLNGWDKPVISDLSESNQIWLLDHASFCLLSLGRLNEGITLAERTKKFAKKLKDLEHFTITSILIGDLYLLTGKLELAETNFKEIVTYTDKLEKYSSQIGVQYVSYTLIAIYSRLATVQRLQGNLQIALKNFEMVEKFRPKHNQKYRLYGVGEYYYCIFLLDKAKNEITRKMILEEGQFALNISKHEKSLSDIAFDNLTIAKVLFTLNRFDEAYFEIDQAVQQLRKAGNPNNDLPEYLLARANILRHQKDFKAAQYDIDESFDIIERCGMKLYEVDANLLQGNLNLDQNQTADEQYKIAKELIAVTGYHLRDPELDLLGARLAFYRNEQSAALYSLKKARDRLEEMGYWGLLPEWEQVEKEFEQ
ncbi:ATP-binding protein [Candidatus Parabeggiatoa sp. HSG14]|uniref:ATP-binding protein n=1 Tax=Candidatus Parabeggiatoa sp. HSG14 TaxID=3055593 RepID=UPI0025A7FEC0|nr:ATP-binding protein [Thiotrichales bacterium HSG14]